ncbi:peptidoglycan-binding protein [Stappia stellulata]|uniref:peptidoglycan-binding domain-containing protein n=1 Tax=Stappia stellulata TaxID=71235 RepID=UPI001CD38CFD|nr:peptidoglycan-binding domain-containing protein [Stappia stellulata]MCA1241814.1 peptidoglycan-binding protein [Stappia stellulata]
MLSRTHAGSTREERQRPPTLPRRIADCFAILVLCVATLSFSGGPVSAQIIDIRPNGPVINPNNRPLICAPPRVMRNGRCVLPRPQVCAPPRVMRNGRCVLPRPQVCAPPRVMRNGRCVLPRPQVCAPPRVMRNGRCVLPRPQVCAPPRVMRNGRCVLPRPTVCAPPRVLRNGRCVLPRPTVCTPPRVLRNGRCVMPPRRPVCRLPYIYSPAQRRCILPVPIPPVVRPQACEAPWQYSRSAGGCICPSGYVVSQGECVRRDSQACTFPFVYSQSSNRCVCAQGYRPYGTGCAPERPRATPQENVRWIQACLNEAGYDAGPVDGVSGRRTRSAWNAFRSENDLGETTAPYSDPETLAKLFQACQPETEPPANPEPETPDEQEEPSGNAPPDGDTAAVDGAFAPADALCASGRLYSLLSAENPSLEPCGRSCIPAPEGMSEEELLRQEETQGITWCRSCVTVGTLGMLCPKPAEAEEDAAPAN